MESLRPSVRKLLGKILHGFVNPLGGFYFLSREPMDLLAFHRFASAPLQLRARKALASRALLSQSTGSPIVRTPLVGPRALGRDQQAPVTASPVLTVPSISQTGSDTSLVSALAGHNRGKGTKTLGVASAADAVTSSLGGAVVFQGSPLPVPEPMHRQGLVVELPPTKFTLARASRGLRFLRLGKCHPLSWMTPQRSGTSRTLALD